MTQTDALIASRSPLSDNVARNARALRLARGWSQQKVANHLGVHLSAVNHVEQHRRRVSIDELYGLAALFSVPVESLVKGPSCETCKDAPPDGFTCNACTAGQPAPPERAAA